MHGAHFNRDGAWRLTGASTTSGAAPSVGEAAPTPPEKEAAGAVKGMTTPAGKVVPPGQGKRAGTGDSQCHHAAGGWRGIQIHGACDDKRILSDMRTRATAVRTNHLGLVVRIVHLDRRRVWHGSEWRPEPANRAETVRLAIDLVRRCGRIERSRALWYRKHPPWRRSSVGQSSGIIIRVS